MAAGSRALAVLLAWLALTAQTQSVQVPPQAVNQYAKSLVATVEATPNPATVNTPVVLQVIITPQVSGSFQYEVYVNGARLTECPTDSPTCQWTPTAPGDYAFNAIVRPQPLGRRGRGSSIEPIGGPRSVLKVDPAPAPTPTPTPTPAPEITLKLLSPRVIAGQPATFSVSIANASPLEYVIDMGDGNRQTRTDAEFTYTYAEAGAATITASYPPSSATTTDSLAVTIEPAPPPPPAAVALQLRAVPDDVKTGESVTFQVSTADGRPLTAYVLDLDDGSGPRTLTSDTYVASYSRPGRYRATVGPAAGLAGTPATALVIVSAPFPWIWIYIVVGIVAVAAVVWIVKRPVIPAATFHPHLDDRLRFEPSKGSGISLEIHYDPNLVSLSYAPRVRIREEPS